MFAPDQLNALREIITDTFNNLNYFYKEPGFYVSLFGLLFAVLSFIQAKKAKEAANSAARKVKTQEIIIEILRIIDACSIDMDISYPRASKICNEITTGISHLSGFFTNETNTVIQAILKNVEVDLGNIRNELNNNNPLIQSQTTIKNQIFYSIEPLFTNIVGNLGRLRGMLESNTLNT